MAPQVTKGHLFIACLLLLVLIIGAYVTAFVAHAPTTIPTQFQTGAVQCQIIVPVSGAAGCIGTISFPKPFGHPPTAFGIDIVCTPNISLSMTSNNASQICQQNGLINYDHPEASILIPVSSTTFFTGTVNWKNFPAAVTPLLGSLNYTTFSNNYQVQSAGHPTYSAFLFLTCEQGSNVASGAVIGLAEVDAGTGTLTPIAGSTIDVTETDQSCALGISLGAAPTPLISSQFNISPQIDIVPYGSGGGGAGDQLIVSQIRMDIFARYSPEFSAGVGQQITGNNSCSNLGMNWGFLTTQMCFYFQAQFTGGATGNVWPVAQWWACSGC